MVLEIAELNVKPGHERDFEAAVQKAVPLFRGAAGCHGMRLHRVVEMPTKYRLVVKWETVEHHTVQFRGSPAFQEWRRLVGEHFASPPAVDHVMVVLQGF